MHFGGGGGGAGGGAGIVRLVLALPVRAPTEAVRVIGYVPGESVVGVVNTREPGPEPPHAIGGIVEPGGIPVKFMLSLAAKKLLFATLKVNVTVAPAAAV